MSPVHFSLRSSRAGLLWGTTSEGEKVKTSLRGSQGTPFQFHCYSISLPSPKIIENYNLEPLFPLGSGLQGVKVPVRFCNCVTDSGKLERFLSHFSSEWVSFSVLLELDVESQFYERKRPGTNDLALNLTVTC